MKIVIADRIAIFVDTVYSDYLTYGGMYLIVATLLFAIQIYCDFGGYSTIAMGAAEILGIHLMENFDAPYLSMTVAEFWRRWHISLSSWFRDYLYIPLGGNRKGKLRKYFNIMVVFLASGLWHGADWSYVVWGGLNGLYQIIGNALMPIRKKFVKLFALNSESLAHKIVKIIITFILVDFSWIFFRANTFNDALGIIKSMFTVHNPWILVDGKIYQCGLNQKNFTLMLFSIAILLFADICKYKNIVIRQLIIKQDYWARWLVIAFGVCFILLFGVWGTAYNEATFIYFQF